MKQSEVKNLSVVELHEEIAKAQNAFSDLKMTHAVSPLENPSQMKETRKTIARLKTELSKRQEH